MSEERELLTKTQAVLSKFEKEELFKSRSRINDLNNFLLRHGFKLGEVDDFLRKDGFAKPIP